MERTEERINKLKDRTTEISQFEKWSEHTLKTTKPQKPMGGIVTKDLICVTGVSEGKKEREMELKLFSQK